MAHRIKYSLNVIMHFEFKDTNNTESISVTAQMHGL